MKDWTKENVLIIGAARQGLALTRYLCTKGCHVTLNDSRTRDQLQKAIDSLSDLSVDLVLGSHPLEALNGITLVCISGGVSPEMPLVAEARNRNIPVSNDAQIFMETVPAKPLALPDQPVKLPPPHWSDGSAVQVQNQTRKSG
jgi:UDP-N-acetylmuramoylalanine--D-glutamate ligase